MDRGLRAYLTNMRAGNKVAVPENVASVIDSYGYDTVSEGKARNFLKNLANFKGGEEIRNSTESRMIQYTAEINPYLYSDNSFITKSTNDASFAASGKTKRLNDSVNGPAGTKGRFQPLTLANGDNAPEKTPKVRKNTGHDWEIEYFHTDPDVISMELTTEIPYEDRQETLQAHSNVLNQMISNFTAVEWAQGEIGTPVTLDTVVGTDFYQFTSGGSRANSVTGNTGTVKKIKKADMKKLKKSLVRQQLANGFGTMYFLPTVEQYDDILNDGDFIDYDKRTNTQAGMRDGVVGSMYGINILQPRHREDWNANVLYSYSAATGNDRDFTKIEDTASAGANMVSAGIAWIDSLVLRAQGSAIVFPWENSPIYMGNVYASELRYSAIKKRNDNKGVVMLIETPL